MIIRVNEKMKEKTKIHLKDIFLPPNLLSLSRVILLIPLGYWLGKDSGTDMIICTAIFFLAGITDYFDGLLARHFKLTTRLGLLIDPLADKVFSTTLVLLLIYTRDFPLWLALLVFSRDLVILGAGYFESRRKNVIPVSDVFGKYYFGSLFFLMAAYIIRFDFGQVLFTWTTIVILIFSLISYGKSTYYVIKSQPPRPLLKESLALLLLRLTAAIILSLFFFRLFEYIIVGN